METSSSARPGRLLDGRYRVGGMIARGGMSTVYRGVDTRLDRPVAIKVMSPGHVSDPAFLARFEREARAAAGLHHSGVVAVYDQGRDGETVFLVMELVDGGTLRDLIRDGPLSVPVTLSILEPLLGALGAAHAAGLVHRDVKPENVLISARGEVKVADFGLVRAVTSHTVATGDVILGTVAYLSPEQVANGTSDARSDVYSAGVVTFEMLTGRPPFTGDNAISVAYQHVHSDVPPVTDEAPGVPVELDELVLAATRRDPDQRPRDAAAFLSSVVSVRARLRMRRVPVPAPRVRARLDQPTRGSAWSSTRGPAGPQGTRMVPVAGPATVAAMAGPQPVTVIADQRPAGPNPSGPGRGSAAGHPGAPAAARSRRRMRRWIIAILVMLLIGTAAALGGWWLGSGRWAYTPASVGVDRVTAENLVRQAGLVPSVSTSADNVMVAGNVVRSSPGAGTRQLRGSQVDLVVSTGRPLVPDVSPGSSVPAATAAIAAAGLKPVLTADADTYDDTIPAGRVVGTEPAAGAPLPIGGQVTVVRSKGPYPQPVPAVTGKAPDDARNALLAAGFAVGPDEQQFDPDVVNGTVIGTDPAAGVEVPRGGQVALVLAASLTVVEVRGRSVADATAALEQAGFTVMPGTTVVFDADIDGGLVTASSPAAGTRVDPANPTVTLSTSNAVTVPDLGRMDRTEAEQTLTDLGLVPDVAGIIAAANAQVIGQLPAAGTRVAPSSTVAVSVFP